jgi:hypothetical protein
MSEAGTGSFATAMRTGSSFTYAVFAAVTLVFCLYVVLVSGPATRAAEQEKLAQTISGETRAFCEKFGMREGSREFLDCSLELATIRERQIERDRAADQGFL